MTVLLTIDRPTVGNNLRSYAKRTINEINELRENDGLPPLDASNVHSLVDYYFTRMNNPEESLLAIESLGGECSVCETSPHHNFFCPKGRTERYDGCNTHRHLVSTYGADWDKHNG